MASIPTSLARDEFVWALGAMCRVHRMPFDASRVLQQFPPPYDIGLLVQAAQGLGMRTRTVRTTARALRPSAVPCIVGLDGAAPSLGLLLRVDTDAVEMLEQGARRADGVPLEAFRQRFSGDAIQFEPEPALAARDEPKRFGFAWFLPELARHKALWRDVALASLALQLVALAVPLLTQVVIDKVIAHHTVNTLIAIGVALAIFVGFSALLTWSRQHLLLHVGNRIDAVLGCRVFRHLLGLPARYFEARPTGSLVARLQGIDTIRQFITGATLLVVLDLPFVAVFLAAMLYYNAMLALLVLGVLAVMVLLSLGMAPVIRRRIDRQFLSGARNQAFVTEHVAGIDTVKSLQMEPQLARRFGSQLSDYLTAGFATGRAHNAYNTAMHALEQTLSLGVLVLGAWIVMQDEGFTIGMLVAFQMFASRVAQPMLRLAGLWQEFQQAGVAVRRLADLMDAPVEPVSVRAERAPSETARIDVDGLCFRPPGRAAELFHGVSFTVAPGECVAISGASGSGKSTLARLLQGIYAPDAGSIRLNGHDLRTLPVNELRAAIGVVPQDTVLFSGSLYENLVLGQGDIELDQVVQACMLAGIHDVVQALPDGYQTAVGEHGAGLSGGQRQRIAVARALLRRPRLLIFDEATSQLDAASAAAVIGAVNQLRGRSTIVFIAHEVPAGLRVDHELRLGAPGTV